MEDWIVAVGLLTQSDLDILGPAFKRAYPIDESPCFVQLLQAIDEADQLQQPLSDGRILAPGLKRALPEHNERRLRKVATVRDHELADERAGRAVEL